MAVSEMSSGHRREWVGTLVARGAFGGAERTVMRQFVAGLLLGLAAMYWYAYQKDAFLQRASDWFAEASADPGAKEKMDKMISRRH